MDDKIANVRIIVGLGNPDREYADTYHNAGYRFVDFLAGEGAAWKRTDLFRYSKGRDLLFAKSDTSMNESGRAVKKMLAFFKLKPEDIAVAHDDADLAIGEYRIQSGRGSAGHRGVASLMVNLKTKDFMRIRIGIREPGERARKKAGDFVLKKIGAAEAAAFTEVFRAIASEIERKGN